MLSGKNILLGITGGIAAYKICELIRMYKRNGANVQVVATPNSLNFVTKLTLQTLSQNEVAVDEFHIKKFKPEHISFADSSDIFVIAPASANTISKIANGICDNLLTSIACAYKKKIIFAPAMNCHMWENPAVSENLEKLKARGYEILEPDSGFLACGYNGKGRLCEVSKIFDRTIKCLNNQTRLQGKKIVITAGGTREKIDTVRYISNYSSGKMGKALAESAKSQGATVKLITTKGNGDINVDSALEMQEAVKKEFKDADILIMAAAVADYRARDIKDFKMKKSDDSDEISIQLVKNPDILKEICVIKRPEQVVVGFCAESENLLENAKEKIAKKGCDYLIANDISRKDIGFSSDYNEIYIFDKNGNSEKIERATKLEIADIILDRVCK